MRKASPRSKVFCIGFQKTGTTSLGVALKRLGYRVEGYDPFRDLAKADGLDMDTIWARAVELVKSYDAFKDTPWPVLYDRLDAAIPDAKFIHVVRDRKSWINSVSKDFGTYPNEIHRLIYGSAFPVGNEAAWLARYDRHNNEVCAHFSGRPRRFVSLDMSKGELDWASLCTFLDQPVPEAQWPHANSRRAKQMNMLLWRFQAKMRKLIGRRPK
jgi:hypothetical protein